MGEIILKVPKKKKKLQLIQQKALLDSILAERQERYRQEIKLYHLIDKENGADILEGLEPINIEEILSYEELKQEREYELELSNEVNELKSNIDNTLEEINEGSENNIINATIDENIELTPEMLGDDVEKTVYTEIYSISEQLLPVKINNLANNKQTIDAELVQKTVQDAYDKGYQDAKEIAMINAQERIEYANQRIREIDSLMVNIREHYKKQMHKLNEDLIDMSITISETIIQKEIENDNNIFIKQIKKCLDELRNNTIIAVKINPDDFEILQQAKSKLINNNKTIENVTISMDENIKKGEVIVQSDAGTIDATIWTQLSNIKELITEMKTEQTDIENIIKDEVSNVLTF